MAEGSTETTNDFDLIVVGGGFAGLSAAVRAAELGLRAIVLEQGVEERYLCNSRMSGGILHMAMRDPYRPPHELSTHAKQEAAHDVDERLVDVLAVSGKRLIEWLQGQGARFMRFGPQEAYRWCMAPPRALAAGMDWEDRGPDRVLQALERRFAEQGGTVRRGTRVDSLRMLEGRCVGVVATDERGAKEWSSRFVLLADGGFQASQELFKRYIGPNFDRVFQRGAATGVGAGLRMALKAGAAMKGSGFYGHLLSRDAFESGNVWPYPQLDMVATAGIVVDGEGRRIADEGRGGVFLTNTLAKLSPDKVFAIIDTAIWEGPGKNDRIPVNPHLSNAGGTIHEADNVAALAEKTGIPVAALQKTIDEYNAALKSGALEKLPVPRSSKIDPWPILQGPFRAIPVAPGITYTMAGIAIDEHAQVLREDGQPIAGLLAAGATTGGIEGGSNVAYLGGLLKAGVFGLLAAERVSVLVGKPEAVRRATADQRSSEKPLASSALGKQGLNRFPVLRAVARYGIIGSIALGALVAVLVGWLTFPVVGGYSIPIGLLAGAAIAVAVASFTELVRLITELLIPE